MQFATSCCNRPLLTSTIKRFWPLMVAVLVVVIIVPGLQILSLDKSIFDSSGYTFEAASRHAVFGAGEIMLPCVAGASLIVALLVFRHLHTLRAVQFQRMLPVTRTCTFVTSCVAGFILMAAPFVVGILVDMAFGALADVPAAISALVQLMAAGLAVMLCMYSLAILSCILAGSTVGAVLIYAAINAALACILVLGQLPFKMIMLGISASSVFASWVTWLMPVYRLADAVSPSYVYSSTGISDCTGFTSPQTIAIYAIVGAALLVACWALYRMRRDEAAGDTVAFKPVEVVCKVLASLIIACLGASVVFSIGNSSESVPFVAIVGCLLVFALVGWVVAEMIARRTVRVFDRKMFAGGAILLVCLAVGLGAMKADVGGRVAYVPSVDEIEQAEVTGTYVGSIVVDPADAIDVHSFALEHRDALTNTESGMVSTVSIDYRLKDGTQVSRTYREPWSVGSEAPVGLVQAHTIEALDKPAYVYQSRFGAYTPAITEESLGYVTYDAYESSGNQAMGYTHSTVLTAAQGFELYTAICEDIDAGRLSLHDSSRAGEDRTRGYVDIAWHGEQSGIGAEAIPQPYGSNTFNAYVPITYDMTSASVWLDANIE